MRKYGQHFLVNERIIEEIAAAVPDGVRDVLEIGPGRGALTEKLLARHFEHLTLVEIDPEMVAYLKEHFPLAAEKIRQGDFLTFDLASLPVRPTFVVSNLPYIDAADILDKVLNWPHFAGAVFMFQKEQAQRILAHEKQAGYGPLSILSQLRARPRLLLKVGKGCFNPPPKVESAVLIFEPRPSVLEPKAYGRFAGLIKAAFLHRRKTLFNAWVLCGYDKTRVQKALNQAQLPPAVRAEEVSLERFLFLYHALTDTASPL